MSVAGGFSSSGRTPSLMGTSGPSAVPCQTCPGVLGPAQHSACARPWCACRGRVSRLRSPPRAHGRGSQVLGEDPDLLCFVMGPTSGPGASTQPVCPPCPDFIQ